MQAIISRESASSLLSESSETFVALLGRVREDEDLVQITRILSIDEFLSSQYPTAEHLIGIATKSSSWRDQISVPLARLAGARANLLEKVMIVAASCAAEPADFALECFLVYRNGECVSIDLKIADFVEEIVKRLELSANHELIAHKRVVVIGLGSGGGLVALDLAKCGVGRFCLIDADRLEAGNVVRHVCGLKDVGRWKTYAVRDLLFEHNPKVEVETENFDVTKNVDYMEGLVRGSDLVIVATDKESPKLNVNEICWQLGIPSVYGAAYNGGFGGDVVRVLPPLQPCYYCFYKYISQHFDTEKQVVEINDESSSGRQTEYGEESPQVGLGLDVEFVALLLARVALSTLLVESGPLGPNSTEWNAILWGNRPVWIFDEPLQRHFVAVEPQSDCPICGRFASPDRVSNLMSLPQRSYQRRRRPAAPSS